MIAQLIELYPNDTFVVNMEDGSTASGTPVALVPTAQMSLLELASGSGNDFASLCKIASIRITSATYNPSIGYLPVPTEPNTCCSGECEAAIRASLPVGTETSISAGGQSSGNKTVIASEFGMIVLVGPNNSSPEFFNTCNIEKFTLS